MVFNDTFNNIYSNTTGAFYVQWYVGCFEALQYFTLEEAT
jgi:hypothetical protein